MRDNVSFVMYHLRNLCIACNEQDRKHDFSRGGVLTTESLYGQLQGAASMAKTCGVYCMLSRNPETKEFDAVGVYDVETEEMCIGSIGDCCEDSVIVFTTNLHGTSGSVWYTGGYCRTWYPNERKLFWKLKRRETLWKYLVHFTIRDNPVTYAHDDSMLVIAHDENEAYEKCLERIDNEMDYGVRDNHGRSNITSMWYDRLGKYGIRYV